MNHGFVKAIETHTMEYLEPRNQNDSSKFTRGYIKPKFLHIKRAKVSMVTKAQMDDQVQYNQWMFKGSKIDLDSGETKRDYRTIIVLKFLEPSMII